MSITERQAKQKWCPHVRLLIGPSNAIWQDGIVTSRGNYCGQSDPITSNCIASECMAWRWAEVEMPPREVGAIPWIKAYRTATGADLKEAKDAWDAGYELAHAGYCGLAGKP